MNTTSNFAINSYNRSFVAIVISIWSFGIACNIISLVVLFISISKLVRFEFYILLSYNVISTFYRILSVVIFFLAYYEYPEILKDCVYSIFNTIWTMMMFLIFMIMFYYSLYQVSQVSRERLFILLQKLVNNLRNFIIYHFLILILVGIVMAYIIMSAYGKLHQCPSVFHLLDYMLLLKLLSTYVTPSLLPVFVYFGAILYVFFSIIAKQKILSSDQRVKRARKDIKLLIKFFILGLVCVFSSLLQNIYLYSVFFASISSLANSFIGAIGFFIYSFQPLCLVYIHSIMKKSAKEFILKRFGFNKIK